MAANLFQKYVWLTDVLYTSGKLTYEQICNKWRSSDLNERHDSTIPKRTFANWRREIEGLFHLNIICDKSENVYFIENVDSITSNKTLRWLLNTFSVTNLISEYQHLHDKILLEDMPSGVEYLSPIMRAIRDGVKLKVLYHSYDSQEAKEFEMEPYCVKAFKQRWYMTGRSSDHPDEIRVYALDRIENLSFMQETYSIPEDFDGQEFFYNFYGVFVGNAKPTTILLKVNPRGTLYMRSLPLHHSQREIETNKEYSLFELYVAPTFDFIQELRTRGEEVEVIAPKEIVDNFVKLNANYTRIYGKNTKNE